MTKVKSQKSKVKSQKSKVISQKSKPNCQMSREIPKDLVISQTLVYSNQLVQIRLAHRLYVCILLLQGKQQFSCQTVIELFDGWELNAFADLSKTENVASARNMQHLSWSFRYVRSSFEYYSE